jgi:hypothetical protein
MDADLLGRNFDKIMQVLAYGCLLTYAACSTPAIGTDAGLSRDSAVSALKLYFRDDFTFYQVGRLQGFPDISRQSIMCVLLW